MRQLNVAVIGMGNMGSKYAELIARGKINGMQLAAVTRVRPERMEVLKEILPEGLPIYQSADELYGAVDAGNLQLDAVIIVTPHYAHEKQTVDAFARNLHVLCDKPAGVYSRQARQMLEARKPELVYAYVFHQRTFPVYKRLRELVQSGRYGGLKRVNWVMTDWYRPNAYYASGSWRATWSGDGGGTLLNQCSHNLDLLQWICGMPARVQAFCHEGKYHPIRVEDEVTAYMEWESKATGIFIASTGEAPGVNRLELSMDNALLVCEKGELRVCELDRPELEYREKSTDLFGKPVCAWSAIDCGTSEPAYEIVLNNFAATVWGEEEPVAPGEEAGNSLRLSNAIYLSSWEKRMVELPEAGTVAEREFEEAFERQLRQRAEQES